MNKRIKQLAEQATTYIEPVLGHSGEGWVFDKEKFAELIVQDCVDILSTYRVKIIFEDGIEYNCVHPIQAIQKHFGVEG